MAYYPDLSPYEYLKTDSKAGAFNVGWLDAAHPYQVGTVPDDILPAILRLCETPINRTRGFHVCQFCTSPTFGVSVNSSGKEIILGSAEIWVMSADGRMYAAPDLIYHYVKEHQYQPPEEFLCAIRAHLSR